MGVDHTVDNEDGTFTIFYTDGSSFTTPDFTGPEGPMGVGIDLLGTLPDESDLPDHGEIGDAYLIDGSIWVWMDGEWINAGGFEGPQGPRVLWDRRERKEIREKTGKMAQAWIIPLIMKMEPLRSYILTDRHLPPLT